MHLWLKEQDDRREWVQCLQWPPVYFALYWQVEIDKLNTPLRTILEYLLKFVFFIKLQ